MTYFVFIEFSLILFYSISLARSLLLLFNEIIGILFPHEFNWRVKCKEFFSTIFIRRYEIFEYIFRCNHDVDEDLLHRLFLMILNRSFYCYHNSNKTFSLSSPSVASQFIIGTMKASICLQDTHRARVAEAPFSFRKFNYFISFAEYFVTN